MMMYICYIKCPASPYQPLPTVLKLTVLGQGLQNIKKNVSSKNLQNAAKIFLQVSVNRILKFNRYNFSVLQL